MTKRFAIATAVLLCGAVPLLAHHSVAGDMGHMENVVTIDDPGAYTKPFTMRFTATWTPGDELLEYICQENNQYGVETLPGGLPPAHTSNSGRK